jgi:hypothetical protein
VENRKLLIVDGITMVGVEPVTIEISALEILNIESANREILGNGTMPTKNPRRVRVGNITSNVVMGFQPKTTLICLLPKVMGANSAVNQPTERTRCL